LRLREATKTLDDIVYRIIADRKRSPGDRGDLLSIFLNAQSDSESGHQMTDKQIRDECLTLFIAGHETTANALSWTLYLLAKNPEWISRARHDIAQAIGNGPIMAESFSAYKILPRIFAEALRLYPPAWTISREAVSDTEVGGIRIKAGATVVMSQWIMHRHPKYWAEPEKFDPDRFLPENEASRPKFAYFPFGGGVRQCIGDQFAWMEGVLVLAALLKKFSPELVSPNYVAEIHPMITLRPRGGMPMALRPN
jgi:cytochrome P450